ncbi:MAG: hypothetical protein F6K48_05775 [Okeania sp. SIO3H1]|uniref:hypothetical protein n=1 Tax=Okeania sp. SIO1I7 TaxID=2607772 RepID=UPI0013C7A5DA|nr:hypothetical protein [Okeania sp. SIO1I7]NEN88458.1 hypothetical protein [Okeania sp. SIO3H1]NET27250.1 hypothetical protein [Okeania sp. SIO1I7]
MNYQNLLPEVIIAELVFQVYRSGILTLEHRKQLRSLFLYHNLTEEDTTAINRLLHAIRRGWLKVAD